MVRVRTRRSRTLAPVAWFAPLLVLLLAGCTGTTATVVPPSPTRVPVEETFISTAIAVIVPVPAYPGDPITVVVKPALAYQAGSPQYNWEFATGLYGPFPSLASEQSAITTSTVGPPAWQNRIAGLNGGGPSDASGLGNGVEQAGTTLPATLAPGYYDVAVTVTLTGSRATARSDTVVQVVARG